LGEISVQVGNNKEYVWRISVTYDGDKMGGGFSGTNFWQLIDGDKDM
jgi:hypothetical protein